MTPRPAPHLARRLLRLAMMLAVLLGGLALGPASPAYACSCVGLEDPSHLERADAVFIGEVVDERVPRQLLSDDDEVVYTVAVEAVLKGEVSAEQEVVSAIHSAACGLEHLDGRHLWFVQGPGRETLVRPAEGQYAGSLCAGTRALPAGAPVPAALATFEPRQPAAVSAEHDGSGPGVGTALAGGAASVAALALLLARRRRRRR